MCHLIAIVLLYFAYIGHSEGLSKINIELKPYEFQYVDNTNPAIPDNSLKYETGSFITEASDSTAPIKPMKPKKTRRKKKKKKVLKMKKPKRMNLRRVFKTRIISTTVPSIQIEEVREEEKQTNENVINLAPIYDRDTGMSYQPEELDKICAETVQISRNFGIRDIESFAKNNCFLIRMYYTNVTCSQINQLVEYCIANGLMNG
ncbi:unnamed protein product [Caenorhabditis angaria]|uniref:aECM cysteine-cradle domain-containing protein n=1 Tax=Caenorhabditis angaria TaxID=860376 RepID=A0A9P1J323_9PELO|nr:unnamed protein product [Caenorhabditis angaria]